MNLLLDTHALIWWMEDNPRLGRRTRDSMTKPGSTVWISAASVWELSIKYALKRLKLRCKPERDIPTLLNEGFYSLAVSIDHALATRSLPLHHADPFDRLLIAQAQCEDLVLVTADDSIPAYDVRTLDAST